MRKRWRGLCALWLAVMLACCVPIDGMATGESVTTWVYTGNETISEESDTFLSTTSEGVSEVQLLLDEPLKNQTNLIDSGKQEIMKGWKAWGYYYSGGGHFNQIGSYVLAENHAVSTTDYENLPQKNDTGVEAVLLLVPVYKTQSTITRIQATGGNYTVKKGDSEVTEAYEGDQITVTAQPDAGYVLDKIVVTATGGSEVVGETEALEKSFTMPDTSVSVAVSFKKESFPIERIPVTEGGSYTVTMDGDEVTEAYEGEQVTVTAQPDTGYELEKIMVTATSGSEVASETEALEKSFTMPGAFVTVEVSFVKQRFSVSLPTGDGYTVSADGQDLSAEYDGSFTFTVTIAEGYEAGEVFAVTAGGVALAPSHVSGKVYTYTINNIKAIQVVAVAGVVESPVSKTPFPIAKTAAEGGSYTVTMDGSEVTEAYEGDQVTVTAQPGTGYRLEQIAVKKADGSAVEMSGNSFVMPGVSVMVEVTFVKLRFSVSLPTGDGYTVSAVGQDLSAEYDGSFTFTVTIAEGYEAGEAFAVTAGGAALNPSHVSGNVYTYTIRNIKVIQVVAVTGVVKSEAPGGTIFQSGAYQLQAGKAYVLGEGTWKVSGETTVYRGGITFYVPVTGEYVFEKQ